MAALIAIALALGATKAAAQSAEPMQRDAVIDLYQGVGLSPGRLLGMGSVATALAEGSATTMRNAASPALKPSTETGYWYWDWHLDWLNYSGSTDHDNDGRFGGDTRDGNALFAAGVTLNYRAWALALSFLTNERLLFAEDDLAAGELRSRYGAIQLGLSGSFLADQLSLGVGVRASGADALQPDGAPLYQASGLSLHLGSVWRPADRNLRLGVAASLPMLGETERLNCTQPAACANYLVPRGVEVPWDLSVGVAWRRAPTRWNREVHSPWRDERYVLLTTEVIYIGRVVDGRAFDAFAAGEELVSGRRMRVSLRGGVEHEWLPGRLRVRAGSYWEPDRVDGVPGRVHVTAGADLRFLQFSFWGEPYRLRLSVNGDVAAHYRIFGLSAGFWH